MIEVERGPSEIGDEQGESEAIFRKHPTHDGFKFYRSLYYDQYESRFY